MEVKSLSKNETKRLVKGRKEQEFNCSRQRFNFLWVSCPQMMSLVTQLFQQKDLKV
jgi:hypothetical protein